MFSLLHRNNSRYRSTTDEENPYGECGSTAHRYIKHRQYTATAAAVIAAVLMTGLMGCTDQIVDKGTEEIRPESVITIGVDSYPPFDYLDTDGQPIGIDVELAREAFGRMGYSVEFDTINWEDKKELLENGDIDCIWCSFTIDGREDEYRWAGPYMVSRQAVAVEPSSDIYSLKDLEGRSVAVQSTTKPETLFKNADGINIPHVGKLISTPNRELIYIFLSKGYVDAVAAHDTAIEQFMRDYDLEYRILDEPLMKVGLGAAFALDDTRGLDTELNRIMQEMLADGTTRRIVSKYLSDPDRYLEVDYEK